MFEIVVEKHTETMYNVLKSSLRFKENTKLTGK